MAPRKTLTVRQRYYVPASPKKVFRYLSEPKRLNRWLVSESELSPRKGGRYTFVWNSGYRHSGKVLEFRRGERLTLTWPQYDGKESLGDTRVRLSVEPLSGGTRLTILHSGFRKEDKWLPAYGGTQAGWAYFAMNQKSVLEEGKDLRSKRDE